MSRYLGIDFSGDYRQWTSCRRQSNIWVAEVRVAYKLVKLHDLRRVQDLPGDESPFLRLAKLLGAQDFEAAGVDAPFSVPREYVPNGEHKKLLNLVAKIDTPENHPFPAAADFVRAVSGQPPPLDPPKPLRATEKYWKDRGLQVRSTLWVRPRGGAAMTSACLSLLRKIDGPIWPWEHRGPKGLLVEAFPMAQLCHWGLPYQNYRDGHELALKNRETIIKGLQGRIDLSNFQDILRGSADALDAVLCAFAAMAVIRGNLAVSPGPSAAPEGWIAVYA